MLSCRSASALRRSASSAADVADMPAKCNDQSGAPPHLHVVLVDAYLKDVSGYRRRALLHAAVDHTELRPMPGAFDAVPLSFYELAFGQRAAPVCARGAEPHDRAAPF